MFYMKEWSEDLDLSEFYLTCAEKGFTNNLSEKVLIDPLRKEKEWNCWILHCDDDPIGSVAAHSFDDVMGPNTYRILARTCAFKKYAPNKGMFKNKVMIEHQHFTDQFFVPACIEWAGDHRVFATSNSIGDTPVKSQRFVHNHYFPMLEKLGLVTKIDTIMYKNTLQSIWEIHKKAFLQRLNEYPRWVDYD